MVHPRNEAVTSGVWPLVGRMGELRHLRELLLDRGRSVVIAGPAGVGKTRLALECLEMAERAGWSAVRIAATRAASGVPLGAFATFLPRDATEGGGESRDLFRGLADSLVEAAGGRRVALLVDDAHLLDAASAALVLQLAGSATATVVATLRTGEPASDAVVALWKDGVAERIELRGLTADGVAEVLASALDGDVDPADAAHLAARCRGNVLFLRELVLGALDDGTLCDDGGIWRLTGPLAPSDRLVELVSDRLGNLAPTERALLELVSFGEPLGGAELSALGDRDLAERLERRGLLHGATEGRRLVVRLAHPLYGDVLRQQIPLLRKREIARALADVVEATGCRSTEDVLRVGTWRLDGGGGGPAVMLAAATVARWRYDFPLAERLARAAVEAGAGFEGRLLAARLASLQDRADEAEAELAELAELATTEDAHYEVAAARLDNDVYHGRIEHSIQVAEEAKRVIGDPRMRDEIAAQRSALLLGTEGPKAAAAAGTRLLDHTSGRACAWASLVAAFSLGRLGRLEEATAVSEKGLSAHVGLSRPLEWYPCYHHLAEGLNLAHAGRFAEASALATSHYATAVTEGSREAQASFAWLFAQMVGERGDVQTAQRRAREAIALVRYRHPLANDMRVHLALALALSGSAGDADAVLRDLDAAGPPTLFLAATDLVQARAWTAVAAGDVSRAVALLGEAVSLAARTGDRIGEASALHGLARLGYAEGAVDRIETLADEVEGILVRARATHVRALARRDHVGLEHAEDAFDAMGAHLLAAEAAADAAVASVRNGDRRRAKAAAHRAANLAARCEGATTPALQAIESRARLTRAERSVAVLAAGGRSNREIAEAIDLSVRTVETHLRHTYEKLGISSRAELSDLLAPVGAEHARPAST
jgi:DNA-binding CsgD family transcriptional regulator